MNKASRQVDAILALLLLVCVNVLSGCTANRYEAPIIPRQNAANDRYAERLLFLPQLLRNRHLFAGCRCQQQPTGRDSRCSRSTYASW